MKRALSLVLLLSVIVSLAGCLPTYVGNPDTATVDPAFVGIWHLAKDGKNELWSVYRMNDHNYLVQAYMIQPGPDGKPGIESAVTCRAWLAEIGGAKFVSMETYSPNLLLKPQDNDSKNRYIVSRIELKDNKLTVRSVAPDFLKTDAASNTPAGLENLIKTNLDKDDLYLDKLEYEKVTPEKAESMKDLLDLIK